MKKCLCCGVECESSAKSCPKCGEATWSAVIAAPEPPAEKRSPVVRKRSRTVEE